MEVNCKANAKERRCGRAVRGDFFAVHPADLSTMETSRYTGTTSSGYPETGGAEVGVKIRCTLDDLLLDAELLSPAHVLRAYDGEEAFVMDALEAQYYELVSATPE